MGVLDMSLNELGNEVFGGLYLAGSKGLKRSVKRGSLSGGSWERRFHKLFQR